MLKSERFKSLAIEIVFLDKQEVNSRGRIQIFIDMQLVNGSRASNPNIY